MGPSAFFCPPPPPPIFRQGDAEILNIYIIFKRRLPLTSQTCPHPHPAPSLLQGLDLLLHLSTQEYNWVPINCQGNLTKCWRVTYDGLASHPGGVAILLVASCCRNRDKLWQYWASWPERRLFKQVKNTNLFLLNIYTNIPAKI